MKYHAFQMKFLSIFLGLNQVFNLTITLKEEENREDAHFLENSFLDKESLYNCSLVSHFWNLLILENDALVTIFFSFFQEEILISAFFFLVVETLISREMEMDIPRSK